jgi:leucyl/phenylalanyl-tRNA--protein transferase
MIKLSSHSLSFPNPKFAHDDDSIIAIGGDLNPNRVLNAYKCGIFPWYNADDPILWWSPNPRFVLYIKDFRVRKSLQKTIKRDLFEVKFDTDFDLIIKNCQTIKRKDQDKSWILDEVIESYTKIYELGFAHCVGVYINKELIGGLYGINFGGMFCGESMFSKVSSASKVAFYYLVQKLTEWGFDFVDCQVQTEHLASFGAKNISRDIFLKELEKTMQKKTFIGDWNNY